MSRPKTKPEQHVKDDVPGPVPDQSQAALDHQAVCRELFVARRSEIQDDMRAMSDAYDKGLLTLSSAALGLSFTVLKDLIPLGDVQLVWLLFASWGMFLVAIVGTLFSFPISISASEDALRNAEAYYLRDDDESFNKPPRYGTLLKWMRWIAGGSFVLALALTSAFISYNVLNRSHTLKESSKAGHANDARSPLAAVEKPDFTKGRVPITSVPVPPVTTGRTGPGLVPKPAAPNTPAPSNPNEGKK
jgi:hypothetical protein